MPLPDWAVEAAIMLKDYPSLVLLEGTVDGEDALLVARADYLPTEDRMELRLVARILDADAAEKVVVDPDKTTVRLLATLDGGEASSNPPRT